MGEKIKLGISACLTGENVRWNGGHSRGRYLTDILGQYVEAAGLFKSASYFIDRHAPRREALPQGRTLAL